MGDHYLVNGSKTFITNGLLSDFVITAVKTDSKKNAKGISLLVLERGMKGFERGKKLEKNWSKSTGYSRTLLQGCKSTKRKSFGRGRKRVLLYDGKSSKRTTIYCC